MHARPPHIEVRYVERLDRANAPSGEVKLGRVTAGR
jgi:hypothetical protein